MLIIYVKHYLTHAGIHYFQKTWFPKVRSIMSEQPGFIDFTYTLDSVDLAALVLKFKDQATFDAWCNMPVHDEVIKELDRYRSRNYWQFVKTEDQLTDPSKLNWTVIRQ